MLDEIDRQILSILQMDGRIANAELARRVGLSPSTTLTRLRQLEEAGFIRQYTAVLSAEKLDFHILCIIHIGLQAHQSTVLENFRQAMHALPEVQACYHITGEYDYLLKVVVRDRHALEQFVTTRLSATPGVTRIHTSLVLSEIKESFALPIPPTPTQE